MKPAPRGLSTRVLLVLDAPEAASAAEVRARGAISPRSRAELFACAPADLELRPDHQVVVAARRVSPDEGAAGAPEPLLLKAGDLVLAPLALDPVAERARARALDRLSGLLEILRARGVKVFVR